MIYNPIDHIAHDDLSIVLGIDAFALTLRMRASNGPEAIGEVKRPRGLKSRFYDRKAALDWLEGFNKESEPEKREIVPHPDWDLMARPAWKPTGALADNFARAGELYPHRLYTPKGIGNAKEFADHFDRGR